MNKTGVGQPVDFPYSRPPQELGKVGLAHAPLAFQSGQSFLGRRLEPLPDRVADGQGQDLGAHLGLESGGQEQGQGVKQGTEVITAQPAAQGQRIVVKEPPRFHGL